MEYIRTGRRSASRPQNEHSILFILGLSGAETIDLVAYTSVGLLALAAQAAVVARPRVPVIVPLSDEHSIAQKHSKPPVLGAESGVVCE